MVLFNFSIVWTSVITLFLIGFYKYVIRGMLKMYFYKKQGLKTEYVPMIGSFIVKMLLSQKKHKDGLYELKKYAQVANPQDRALVRNFGSTPIVQLFDPVLKKEFAFMNHLYALPNFSKDFAATFMKSLNSVSGEEWKKQRKIISQSFHFEFIKDGVPVMVDTTQELLNDLAKKDLSKVEMLSELEALAGENIARVFFSSTLR